MKTTCGRGRIVVAGPVLASLLAWSSSALALNPALDVSQYAHTAWRIREGFAKGVIAAIAQTLDGYLWLGTDAGLYRFDGIKSVAWQPPSDQYLPSDTITHLLAARDGTLWIGTAKGLVSWKAGRLTQYVELAGRRIGRLVEDREGSIWMPSAAGEWTLCEIRNGGVRCHGGDGGPGAGVIGLHQDGRGTLWAGTSNGLWRWKPGAPRFYPQPAQLNGIQGFADGDDGALLVSEVGGLRRFVDGKAEMVHPFPASMQQFDLNKLLRDRDGGIWVGGTIGSGLLHVHKGMRDAFAEPDGLSGDGVTALFEDREGSVWVATRDGLDRFHDTAVATLSVRQGLSNAAVQSILAAKDGSVWLGTSDGLDRWKNGSMTAYGGQRGRAASASGQSASRNVRVITGRGLPSGPVASLFQDRLGRVWLSTRRSVGYLDGDHVVPVAGLPGGPTRGMVEDDEHFWFASWKLGLFRVSPDARQIQATPWAGLKNRDQPSAVAAESTQKGVWVGFVQGGIVHFADGQVRASFGPREGLPEGTVRHLRLAPDGALWAATEGGLSRVKDARVATLNSGAGLPCDAVQWLVEDDARSFWLGMRCGLVRIEGAEMDAWAVSSEKRHHVTRTTVFDSADGFRTYVGTYPAEPAVKAADGRLWFISPGGVSVVDPHHLPFNTLPPPVHVEQITADRRTYEVSPATAGHMSLPPLVRDLEIDYTALSLVASEKNRFRYKLEGFDADWQEVGNRRQAFYTNLPPRQYRFRVIASNNNGVWNETGAALDLSIAPAYYQMTWFRASAVLAALALLWAAYEYRVRQLAHVFDARLQERVNERTRIARELHDTLLQSFHGLLFRFQAATNMLPESDVKQKFESAIDQAAQAIAEGRDAVQNLRGSTTVTNDLAEALSTLGGELASAQSQAANANPTVVDVAVEGTSRDLHPIVRDDIYRIAGEALRNAFRHAHARHIEVRIRYDDPQLQVRVRDDGKGIDAAVRDDQRPGHFGMPGMRERAELVGGKLEVWSEVGLGTEVDLRIPAAAAYAAPGARPRRWLSLKGAGADS
ncbi:MAG TPA: two-component regulator propeller domain-containing protein [Vicinamibacterales bacterium]|nr:two-component regulator propeller domain-containing protein [Vicinamibacterales bacterium]